MYRKDGNIPTISRDKYPHRIMVFDTEAYRSTPIMGTEVQTFRIAVTRFIELNDELQVIDSEFGYYQDSPGLLSCFEHYTRKDKSLYVYAHNIKYDLQLSGVLKDLLESGWVIKTFVFEDPPTFIKLSKGRASITFIDTFNYWQFSLAKMGDQLNIPKLPMPEDTANPEAWYTYCKRDVEVLSDYLITFIRYLKDNDLCGLGLTLASQSFRSYRHRFMKHSITLHNRPEITAVERSGYSGGRVEAFRIGQYPKQNYYKLDVNSMYPFVMKKDLYPHSMVGYTEDITPIQLEKNLNRYYCIAEVVLNTPEAAYPVKALHKLIFPIGIYTATLHHSELLHALHSGHIVTVNKIAAYEQADLFSEYIDFFYNMKLQAELDHNAIIRHQAKIMMNSLYGKFGQREVRSKITPNITPTPYGRITGYSESLSCRVEVNCLGSSMEVSFKQGESTYSFPAIAGAVTANARMYLWKLINTAGLEHCFYIDTDSLVVDKIGLEALTPYLNNTDLGMLKLEDTSDNFLVWGAKDYTFGAEVKHKGVPKSAKEITTGLWNYEQFRGAKTWLGDGLNKNVEVYSRTKQRISVYDKGIIRPDNTVSPIILR